uniref:Uncharacterized protein n=1 Tax=Anguilla anguilla TaxID=7936 RepID=A0A0E9PR66_ANGAN
MLYKGHLKNYFKLCIIHSSKIDASPNHSYFHRCCDGLHASLTLLYNLQTRISCKIPTLGDNEI